MPERPTPKQSLQFLDQLLNPVNVQQMTRMDYVKADHAIAALVPLVEAWEKERKATPEPEE